MDVQPGPVVLAEVCEYVESTFLPLAEQQGLDLIVELEDGLPDAVVTDEQRLQQVLKNLLSNALKFTEYGSVRLSVHRAPAEMLFATPALNDAGDGRWPSASPTPASECPAEKLKLIFEAFQQADGTTSRRYGGTGLGTVDLARDRPPARAAPSR
jgi:signal transduction histidine kinase